jgi:hypothetical protein
MLGMSFKARAIAGREEMQSGRARTAIVSR